METIILTLQEKLDRLWDNPMVVSIRRIYFYSFVPFIIILITAWATHKELVWLSSHHPRIYGVIVVWLSVMSYLSQPVFVYLCYKIFGWVYYGGGEIIGCCWICFCMRRSDRIRDRWTSVKTENNPKKKN